jgi:hypothetical protein
MPFTYTSNNAIPPAQTLVAFLVSVVAGARRLAHTDWLRADKALHALLGIVPPPKKSKKRERAKKEPQIIRHSACRPIPDLLFSPACQV